MRKYGAAGLLGLTLAAASVSAFAATVNHAAGGFSYTAPPGWKVGHLPQARYIVAYGRPAGGFAPNIVVVDETAPMSLTDYVRANMVQMQKHYPGYHSLGQSPFVTRNGLHGIKMVAVAAPLGRSVRQIFYLFSAKGSRKIVVTASSLAEQGSRYDATMDAAMKTFVLK